MCRVRKAVSCRNAISLVRPPSTVESWDDEELARFEDQLSRFDQAWSLISSLSPESVLKELRNIVLDTTDSNITTYQLDLALFCVECLVEYAK